MIKVRSLKTFTKETTHQLGPINCQHTTIISFYRDGPNVSLMK